MNFVGEPFDGFRGDMIRDKANVSTQTIQFVGHKTPIISYDPA
jgi:hypothetical protein